MMRAIIYSDVKSARDRDRQAWVERLGRPKRPEDITEFLFGVVKHPTDGRAAMMVEDESRLTAAEKGQLVSEADIKRGGFISDELIPPTRGDPQPAPTPPPIPFVSRARS